MRALVLGAVLFLSTLSAAAQSAVEIRLKPPSTIDSELRSIWTATITNLTSKPIAGLHYYISANPYPLVAVPAGCITNFPSTTDCTIDLAPAEEQEISFTLRSPSRFGHYGVVMDAPAVNALAYDEAVFGREYAVTSTADSGPGTLRQALVDINQECGEGDVPCVAAFRIDGPVPRSGWFRIEVLSPLPVITAGDVFIDGGAQSRHTGQTARENGPEVLIDGSAAGSGNGLEFRNSSRVRVADIAIGGFPENGIENQGAHAMIVRSYVGIDPDRVNLPNLSRGVVFVGGAGYVMDSALVSNRRSGGFFWTIGDVRVLRNHIGGNGASGLFFHKPELWFQIPQVYDNVIVNNRHAGIGLSMTATGDFARNSFADNGAGPIDIGLNGPSTTTVTGIPGQGAIIGAPIITSAKFANGVTTVTGRVAPRAGSTNSFQRVSILGGPGDLQALLATANVQGEEFTFTIDSDLRGGAVRAVMYTNVIYDFDHAVTATSEVGLPRVVE